MDGNNRLITLADYETQIGAAAVEELMARVRLMNAKGIPYGLGRPRTGP